MFGFKSKKADVLDHWIGLAENFQCPSAEFYSAIEQQVNDRKLPGLEMSRVDFAEGGLLSDKRVYLRMLRERLVFDICAAPFGTGSFFSCRMAEIPAVVKLWELLVFLCGMSVLLYLASSRYGFLGILGFLILIVLAFYVMRNAAAMGLPDLDTMLIRTPVIGPIYEAWIRKETYYRVDTRLMFLMTIPAIVKAQAEETVSAKGVKLVHQFERAPILRELYKPVAPRPEVPRAG